jgi:hypothetical protein
MPSGEPSAQPSGEPSKQPSSSVPTSQPSRTATLIYSYTVNNQRVNNVSASAEASTKIQVCSEYSHTHANVLHYYTSLYNAPLSSVLCLWHHFLSQPFQHCQV